MHPKTWSDLAKYGHMSFDVEILIWRLVTLSSLSNSNLNTDKHHLTIPIWGRLQIPEWGQSYFSRATMKVACTGCIRITIEIFITIEIHFLTNRLQCSQRLGRIWMSVGFLWGTFLFRRLSLFLLLPLHEVHDCFFVPAWPWGLHGCPDHINLLTRKLTSFNQTELRPD